MEVSSQGASVFDFDGHDDNDDSQNVLPRTATPDDSQNVLPRTATPGIAIRPKWLDTNGKDIFVCDDTGKRDKVSIGTFAKSHFKTGIKVSPLLMLLRYAICSIF